MHRPICNAFLVIGFLLAMTSSGIAQDASSDGQGYMPMAPVSPRGSNGFDPSSTIYDQPTRPGTNTRPSGWAGNVPSNASPWPQPDPNAVIPVGDVRPCEGTAIIARVGSAAILESDVIGAVNEIIEANKSKIPPDQLDKQRELLLQQRLKNAVEMKLIYEDARRTIPSERWTDIEKQLDKTFDEEQLERMIKKSGVANARELDQKLRTFGTSLEREKRAFTERTLAQQWARQQVKGDEEITYDQMLTYYREHQDEFTTPARAKWEELMVRFSKYPTRVAAFDAIARMGNQVLGGSPLADVAKAGSDGTTAQDGGRRDWISRGSHVCAAVDAALFQLPIGQMSPILESEQGYHIVRVVKREDTAVKPFLDAQVDIKQKIVRQRNEKQFREYMEKLQARTPVWTIFDKTASAQQVATPRMPLCR
ncbi:MAG: peptidyl-prolyl cis-trans isomerase [Thermoguttaceae bacterium]